jgi:hypothetical protein
MKIPNLLSFSNKIYFEGCGKGIAQALSSSYLSKFLVSFLEREYPTIRVFFNFSCPIITHHALVRD